MSAELMDNLKSESGDSAITVKSPVHFSRLRIIKNAVVLGVVFFITFTAYDCLSMLQSTLNHEKGIGVISQSTVYAGFCISSLLLPKYVIKKLGCKATIIFSMCLYLPYIAANLYPHWAVMIPAAAINGLVASLLWGSQSIYLNKISVLYASLTSPENNDKKEEIKNKQIYIIGNVDGEVLYTNNHSDDNIACADEQVLRYTEKKIPRNASNPDIPHCSRSYQYDEIPISLHEKRTSKIPIADDKSGGTWIGRKNVEATTARFFGIFGMAYLSTHMWSNLMSYFILENDSVHVNVTLNSSCVCGAQFCNVKSDCFMKNLQEPSIQKREFLTGLCLSMGVVSIVILVFFLDPLNDQIKEVKFSLELVFATFKQSKKKKQALLIPLSFYIGMIQGFYTGDFNASYIGCAWGTYHVSLVSVCYGGMCSLASLSGSLVTKFGRLPIFMAAALVNAVALILLLTWAPTAENPAMFFLIAALWGTSVGVLWSQSKAMYGFLFKKNEEAAFATYHLWYSLGFCVSFAYSNHFCTYIKLYILLSVLIVGMTGYLFVEISERHRIKE